MRAEFYGGIWNDQVHEVESDRSVIYVPKYQGTSVSWIQPHIVKQTSPMTVERYNLAVRYPDRLIYVSIDDEGFRGLWMGLRTLDPHVVFCMWKDGRFAADVRKCHELELSIIRYGFTKFCDRKYRLSQMRRQRIRRKSAKKIDPI